MLFVPCVSCCIKQDVLKIMLASPIDCQFYNMVVMLYVRLTKTGSRTHLPNANQGLRLGCFIRSGMCAVLSLVWAPLAPTSKSETAICDIARNRQHTCVFFSTLTTAMTSLLTSTRASDDSQRIPRADFVDLSNKQSSLLIDCQNGLAKEMILHSQTWTVSRWVAS